MDSYFNVFKAIPICGVSMSNKEKEPCLDFKLETTISGNKIYFNPRTYTKEEFKRIYHGQTVKFFDGFESDDYDLVIEYKSLRDNSEEVNYIKCILTVLYLANRWANEKVEFEPREIFVNIYERFYRDKSDHLIQVKAPIKIGPKPADSNFYNESITRLYGTDLESEYNGSKRYQQLFDYRNPKLDIEVSANLKDKIDKICSKLNDGSDYSKKMISAFRLYFDTIPEYDIEKNIINYATIFEILLLDDKEENQRKKVSARATCLLCDGLGLNEKEYLSEIIYQFYCFRNQIVHNGYSYIDLGDSICIEKMLNCIKNSIYFIIKKIIRSDIKDIKNIKDIVEKNMKDDGLENSFDYIPSYTSLNNIMTRILSGDHYEFSRPNTAEERRRYRQSLRE